ncbi:efflux RND transporter periplasmic adaptor subunit [Kiritimatiellaeota bacterium B1221]|nr:efflux RND transporter periplasmic adaptor subunit [Kiritimatiellaeota bacterium B1221]
MKSTFSVLSFLFVSFLSVSCRKPNEFQPPPPPQVTVENPEVKDVVLYDTFPGLVDARESVTLVARVNGFLEEVHFDDGAKVQEGDLLFTIEQEGYLASLNAAKATLAQAEAGLSLAQASLSRKEKAYESQAVSELDVLTAKADVQGAEAAVQAAASAVEGAELNLSYTKIVAPMSGIISRKYVSEGNLVGPGAVTELALLLSIDKANVYFSADERRLIPKLRMMEDYPQKGGKFLSAVKLALSDGQDYDLEGKIDYMDNSLDTQTGTLKVRAVFENPEGFLVQGMFAKVKIPKDNKGAILIPEIAVQRDMVGSFVYTLTAEDKVESVYVKLGALYGQQRIIQEGLGKSDRVVTRGIQRVRPGASVTVSGSPKGE